MQKPTMKSEWRGQPGNKFRIYIVKVEGKEYVHGENKAAAVRQFDAAMSVYHKRGSKAAKARCRRGR